MRVIREISATYEPRAECSECDWEHGYGRSARNEAKWHVRSTGHLVIVVTEKREAYRRNGA